MLHATANTRELDEQISITERRLQHLRDERERRRWDGQRRARRVEQFDRRMRFTGSITIADKLTPALNRMLDDLDTQVHPDDAGQDPILNDDGAGDRWDGLS